MIFKLTIYLTCAVCFTGCKEKKLLKFVNYPNSIFFLRILIKFSQFKKLKTDNRI